MTAKQPAQNRHTPADNRIPLSFDDLVRGVLQTDPKTLPSRKKAAKKKAAKRATGKPRKGD